MVKRRVTTPELKAGKTWEQLEDTAAKRFKKVENATALIWKILQVAESTFRKLKGAELLPDIYAGVQYRVSVKRRETAQQPLAA